MAIDNQLYNRARDIWWDEAEPLSSIRTALNPGRLEYFRWVFQDQLGRDPTGLRALDVGCGGGLLAEEATRLGLRVTGIDPSEASLVTAREHAGKSSLAIDYRQGTGEELPFADGTFDVVYCCDVLEHVEELERVIAETARVLVPGGIYIYDTINRTFPAKLIYIKLFQEWSITSWMPPHLHDWRKFIKPAELTDFLAQHGLQNRDLTGLTPSAKPPTLFRLLRQRKRGLISCAELGRRSQLRLSRDLSTTYLGYAVKAEWIPACGEPTQRKDKPRLTARIHQPSSTRCASGRPIEPSV